MALPTSDNNLTTPLVDDLTDHTTIEQQASSNAASTTYRSSKEVCFWRPTKDTIVCASISTLIMLILIGLSLYYSHKATHTQSDSSRDKDVATGSQLMVGAALLGFPVIVSCLCLCCQWQCETISVEPEADLEAATPGNVVVQQHLTAFGSAPSGGS